MSEHQRGAWGSREDNSVSAASAAAAASSVWWPSAADQQSHQQQLLTQHHQQQLVAAVQQQQQHEAAARSTAAAAAAQQFLSYKMSNNSFQNIISSANTNSISSVPNTINTGGGMRYDYGSSGGRPGDAALAANQAAQAAAAAAQWWSYPASVAAAGLQNNANLQNHLQNANAVNTLLVRCLFPLFADNGRWLPARYVPGSDCPLRLLRNVVGIRSVVVPREINGAIEKGSPRLVSYRIG